MRDVSEAIVEELRAVADPCCAERGISVIDMGLLRSIEVDGSRVHVELLLTSGWCPFIVDLTARVQERVAAVPGVEQATVEVVCDEAWTTDRLSPSARRALRFLPDPAKIAGRDAWLAAHPPTERKAAP